MARQARLTEWGLIQEIIEEWKFEQGHYWGWEQ